MTKNTVKLSVLLAVACALAAGTLFLAHAAPDGRTNQQKTAELKLAITNECIPGSCSVTQVKDRFIGYDKNGRKIGYAFRVSPAGYGGAIDMVVGIDTKGKVAGIKILSMRETPLLGMRASEPGFLRQFTGKTFRDPLLAKKDIDAVTGATITSQAVANGVKQALAKYRGL